MGMIHSVISCVNSELPPEFVSKFNCAVSEMKGSLSLFFDLYSGSARLRRLYQERRLNPHPMLHLADRDSIFGVLAPFSSRICVVGDIHGDASLTLRSLIGSGKFEMDLDATVECYFDVLEFDVRLGTDLGLFSDIVHCRYIPLPSSKVVEDNDTRLVFLGDYCDRGEDSLEVVAMLYLAKFLLEEKGKGAELDLIFGDHELYFLEDMDGFDVSLKQYYSDHDMFLEDGPAYRNASFKSLKLLLREGVKRGLFSVAIQIDDCVLSHSLLPYEAMSFIDNDLDDMKLQVLNQQLQDLGEDPSLLLDTRYKAIFTLINHVVRGRIWSIDARIWRPCSGKPMLFAIGHEHSVGDYLPREIPANRLWRLEDDAGHTQVLCLDTDSSYVYGEQGRATDCISFFEGNQVHAYRVTF